MVVFALSLCCLAQANPNHSDLEEEVLSSFQSLVEASKRLDTEAYFQHFDADKFQDETKCSKHAELQKMKTKHFRKISNLETVAYNK